MYEMFFKLKVFVKIQLSNSISNISYAQKSDPISKTIKLGLLEVRSNEKKCQHSNSATNRPIDGLQGVLGGQTITP